MRTTVDIPDDLLRAAKERAARKRQSLSLLVQRALREHLESEETGEGDEPFDLLVAGKAGGRHPTPDEVHRLLDEDEWRPPR